MQVLRLDNFQGVPADEWLFLVMEFQATSVPRVYC